MKIQQADLVNTLNGTYVINQQKNKKTYLGKPFPYADTDKIQEINLKDIKSVICSIKAKDFQSTLNTYNSIKDFYNLTTSQEKETFYKELLSQKEAAYISLSSENKEFILNTMYANNHYFTMLQILK